MFSSSTFFVKTKKENKNPHEFIFRPEDDGSEALSYIQILSHVICRFVIRRGAVRLCFDFALPCNSFIASFLASWGGIAAAVPLWLLLGQSEDTSLYSVITKFLAVNKLSGRADSDLCLISTFLTGDGRNIYNQAKMYLAENREIDR